MLDPLGGTKFKLSITYCVVHCPVSKMSIKKKGNYGFPCFN